MKYQVTLSFIYEFEADSEDSAEYLAINALKVDLPENCAPMEVEVAEVVNAE